MKNLKLRFGPKSNSPFSEVSYPHPWREFKLLKREVVYNFDVMKCKRRYLGKNILLVSIIESAGLIVFRNDIRSIGL